MTSVTVVTPTIPPRKAMLKRAMGSVIGQTRQPDAISIVFDHDRTGSAATRNRALDAASTEWIAFLDDDDQLLPNHLELLLDCAEQTGADLVYPRPQATSTTPTLRFGLPFDPDALRHANYIPVTVLARTNLVIAAGGFQCPAGYDYDDWGLWLSMLNLGAEFVHLPQETWLWNGNPGQNTSGRPDRW